STTATSAGPSRGMRGGSRHDALVTNRNAGLARTMNEIDGGLFRGWQVVAAAFSVLFLSYGLQFSYGVFVSGMAADLGWSRAQTALPYSIYVFVYSALSAATGRATDRFGPRPGIAAGPGRGGQ